MTTMDFALTLIAVALLLTAIAPVLMAGGACIAAFMLQKNIFRHLLLTAATLAALLLSALVVTQLMAEQAAVTRAIVLAAPVWAVYFVLHKLLIKPTV